MAKDNGRLACQIFMADDLDGLVVRAAERLLLIGSPNQVEAVGVSMENRAPRFRDVDA